MSKLAILCVDDEVMVLDSLEIELKRAFNDAYLYEMAESADEAMEIIEELQEETISIIVILSDWLMPGIKGDEFLIQIHEKYPKVIKIMLTGQADDAAIERAKTHANLHSCLRKPWNSQDLIETIKSGLAKL
ncbi:MAG: response regulator [Coleofasciculus sp. S288]|nr:response regulator [Coleofasciculus sp. S288]